MKEDRRLFQKWKEQQTEQALARITGKDIVNQPGFHWTRSGSTKERGKEKQDQGSQTEDIRNKLEYSDPINHLIHQEKAEN